VKAMATNAPLAIVTVVAVLLLITAHEVLAAIAGTGRFVVARRWLVRGFTVAGIVLTVLIAARFYYLRAA
jgi:hypothetical protein